jgi:hypothetical protein
MNKDPYLELWRSIINDDEWLFTNPLSHPNRIKSKTDRKRIIMSGPALSAGYVFQKFYKNVTNRFSI